MKNKNMKNNLIYQSKSGKIEFRGDLEGETIWGTQQQIANVFEIDRTVVTRHIGNIFQDGEVDQESNVQKIHIANSDKPVKIYSLDMILSVGYRVNSSKAILFRKWATKVLRKHIVNGYTVSRKRVGENYEKFLVAISGIRAVLPKGGVLESSEVLDLVNSFALAWLSLGAYDSEKLPGEGVTKRSVMFTANELVNALSDFRQELVKKDQATVLFGQERYKGSVAGIVDDIFQSFQKGELYATVEHKAAHLLYAIVKDRPFADGNKRSGAFAFVWFLRMSGVLRTGITPEALTALTILVAESDPKDKDKIIGLVLILLQNKY
ncbi:RhuM family protein [Patescibacteria group bacterium]